jgi:hypothetical protein
MKTQQRFLVILFLKYFLQYHELFTRAYEAGELSAKYCTGGGDGVSE